MLRNTFAAVTLSATFLFAAPALAGDDSALASFQKSHEAVIELVEKKAPNDKIQDNVDSLLDYNWIAQQSLGGGKRYSKKCEPRCAEFEALLSRLIRENYLRRIRQSDKGKVKYLGEERRADKAKVSTQVSYTAKNGQPQEVKVAYVMHLVDGRWVVRNIITDGVSLAKNYRYEFNKILRDEGIDGLIGRLETKLNEVAKTDVE